MVNRIAEIEVVILGRGGGSSEDLAAFNREIVARAIVNSRAPVVSAVGHEIDLTIADLVADKRALTPSEAAELVSPDRSLLMRGLHTSAQRMRDILASRLAAVRQRWQELVLRRPLAQPLERIREHDRRVDDIEARLAWLARQKLTQARQAIDSWAARLEALSPLNVLARGYSLTRREDEQILIRDAAEVQAGDRLVTILQRGRIISRALEIHNS
jgi:exodeoxyribonuclease VII large subunit